MFETAQKLAGNFAFSFGKVPNSVDAVTAQVVHLPWELLEKMSDRIVHEVEGVNRVVYDITAKPPGTIEWE